MSRQSPSLLAIERNPLYDAIEKGNMTHFEALLENETDVNRVLVGRAFSSYLFCAIANDQVEMAKKLLEKGANPDYIDTNKQSVFHILSQKKTPSKSDLLELVQESFPRRFPSQSFSDATLLHFAVEYRNRPLIKAILDDDNTNPNALAHHYDAGERLTALSLAVLQDDEDSVLRFINLADVNTAVNFNTPLRLAVLCDNVKIFRLILSRYTVDQDQRFIVEMHDFFKQHFCEDNDLHDLILRKKIITNIDYRALVLEAIKENKIKTLKRLLANCNPTMNLSFDSNSESNPLFLAASYGHIEIVSYLAPETLYACLESNFDNGSGNTPLTISALCGNFDVFRLLLSKFFEGENAHFIQQTAKNCGYHHLIHKIETILEEKPELPVEKKEDYQKIIATLQEHGLDNINGLSQASLQLH